MSFPAYTAYKDSGVDWLGVVPDHWTVTLLKRGYQVVLGKMLQPEARRDDDELLPYLRAANIQLSGVDNVDVKRMWFSAEEKKSLLLRRGDLLVSEGGDVGRSAIWNFDDEECYFQNSINRVRSIDGNSTRFLYFWMIAIKKNGYVDVLCNKSTIAHFTAEKVAAVPLPIPTKSEQTQIARFLDHETARIDALIEEQQRLIELLKEKRQAVISHAVTKGLDPTIPMKDSGAEWLGEVPAHWETLRIGAVYSEAADKGLAELPVLRVSIHHGVSDKELSEEESDRKITRIDDREKYKRVRPGDLVYNMMRAWQGGFGAVLVDGLVSPAYVVARPKNEDISRYVEQLLRTGCAVEEMRKNSYGITDFRLRLYWDQFKNIVIVIPPEVERQQIMERIDSLINESEALKSEADRLIVILQERRSALISAAVTGKIDVRGWQPPARAQAPVLEAEAV